MTNRIEAAKQARATAATYTRVGSHDAAAQRIRRAEQYEAMTDAEYEADRAKYASPARDAAVRRMAAEMMSR